MLARRQFIGGVAVSMGALSAHAANPQMQKPQSQSRAAHRGELLSPQTLEDALIGSSYLGCGGGGGLKEARALIASDLASGHEFRVIGVHELADAEYVACPYALESLAPVSEDMQARLDNIDDRVEAPTLAAFSLLERHLDEQFSAVILGEIGPLSMAEGLSIAARLGRPALDADTVGRATPEINQHSVRVAGHPLTPAAGVTLFGDEVILQSVQDPSREEDVFRSLSTVSRLVGVTDAPVSGAVAKSENVLVTGSLSLAINIGAAVRNARSIGMDPIESAQQAGEGYTLFTGAVEKFDWKDQDGFLVGDLILKGTGEYAGQTMRLDYKNEHLVARRDDKIVATCPDLITVIDTVSHEGVNNPDFEVGQGVRVLGFKSDPIWRTPAGLAVFSPRYFGYDVDYIPIEDRL